MDLTDRNARIEHSLAFVSQCIVLLHTILIEDSVKHFECGFLTYARTNNPLIAIIIQEEFVLNATLYKNKFYLLTK